MMGLRDKTGESLATFLALPDLTSMFVKIAIILGLAVMPVLLFPFIMEGH